MHAPDPSRRYLNSPGLIPLSHPPRTTNPAPPWHARTGGRAALLLGAATLILFVQAWHLHRLSETRRAARAELSHALLDDATMPPERRAVALAEAFDRTTQDVLFAASGPHLILAVAVLCLTAQTARLRWRLAVVERLLAHR